MKNPKIELTSLERRTLNVLDAHADSGKPRSAVLVLSAIACEAGASERAVRAALSNLERFGVVRRIFRPGPYPTRFLLL